MVGRSDNHQALLDWYRTQSVYSDPGRFGYLYRDLPDDIGELTGIIRGLVVHQHLTESQYGFDLPRGRENEPKTRYIEKILEQIIRLDNKPLTEEREPRQRFIGLCRDYALLLSSILKFKGIPARVRCGFANYFEKGYHVDHWLCECYREQDRRWVLVDTEIDDKCRAEYAIPSGFDQLDVSQEDFWPASKAWRICRQGEAEPSAFGVPTIGVVGEWFVRASLFKDLAAVNKVELCPWDYTENSDKKWETIAQMPNEQIDRLDEVAEVLDRLYDDPQSVVDFYRANEYFQVGKEVTSYTTLGPMKVVLNHL